MFFAIPSDPVYSRAVLQLPCTGANDSTTFTDQSVSRYVPTGGGASLKISTSQSMFGGGSLWVNGGTLTVNPFVALSGDFTLEAFVRTTAVAGGWLTIMSLQGGFGLNILFAADQKLRLYRFGTSYVTSTDSLAAATWTHVAVVRASGVTSLYMGGVYQGNTAGLSMTMPTIFYIGYDNEYTGFTGHVGPVRISTIAVYTGTGTFTPPTTPFGSRSPDFIVNTPSIRLHGNHIIRSLGL